MGIVGNIFGWIGGWLKKLPLWLWVGLVAVLIIGGGWKAWQWQTNRMLSGYEKTIKDSNDKIKALEIERDTANSMAALAKAQRDAAIESTRQANEERLRLTQADSAARVRIADLRARLAAEAANDRAALTNTELFKETLDGFNVEVECAIANINQPGSCVQ